MRFSRNTTGFHDLTGDQYKMINDAGKESVCSGKKNKDLFLAQKLLSSLMGTVIAKIISLHQAHILAFNSCWSSFLPPAQSSKKLAALLIKRCAHEKCFH